MSYVQKSCHETYLYLCHKCQSSFMSVFIFNWVESTKFNTFQVIIIRMVPIVLYKKREDYHFIVLSHWIITPQAHLFDFSPKFCTELPFMCRALGKRALTTNLKCFHKTLSECSTTRFTCALAHETYWHVFVSQIYQNNIPLYDKNVFGDMLEIWMESIYKPDVTFLICFNWRNNIKIPGGRKVSMNYHVLVKNSQSCDIEMICLVVWITNFKELYLHTKVPFK